MTFYCVLYAEHCTTDYHVKSNAATKVANGTRSTTVPKYYKVLASVVAHNWKQSVFAVVYIISSETLRSACKLVLKTRWET